MATKQVSVSTRIEAKDLPKVAEAIVQELRDRQKRRKDLENNWEEVDRQLRLEPELSHKLNIDGTTDKRRAWMPEVELPLQAQTLEMLMSDNRRLKFPPNRDWFKCRAAITDDYLKKLERAGSLFVGEKESRSIINQDNADRLAQGLLSHWHSQYDFRAHIDLIDGCAFKYSFGVGRLKKVKRNILGYDQREGPSEQVIPVLVPRDPKKVYLDDSQHAVMHEGFTLGPNIIQIHTMKLADLQAAAKDNDTYIPSEINRLKTDKTGDIELVELEGDLVVDRGTDTVIEKDIIVTAAIGSGDDATAAVVRVQEGQKMSTYLVHNYHVEGPSAYGTSPLLKGMPVAKSAAQALNRVMESGQLKNSPPIGYSPDDVAFAASGGPVIQPYATWESVDEVRVHDEVGGDPATLFATFTGLVNLYYDVTGVNQPRLGAQTKSHTTAFAKDVEISQGSIRTVDYIRSSLEGPMTRLLQMEYKMGLSEMKGSHTIYIEPWNEFVNVKRGHMPDIVKFIAIGSGAPAEDQARSAERANSAQLAIQLDQFSVQLGNDPTLDIPALITQTLNEGGWTDVSAIVKEAPVEGVAGNGQLPGALTQEVDTLGI